MHAAWPRQWRAADIEVYRYTRGPRRTGAGALLRAGTRHGAQFPIEWTVRYGKGRVYTSTLGHVWPGDPALKGVQCAGFQTLLFRALDWLAGKPVDGTVPADFPSPDQDIPENISRRITRPRFMNPDAQRERLRTGSFIPP